MHSCDPKGAPSAIVATELRRVLVIRLELDGNQAIPTDEVIGEALIKTLAALLMPAPPTAGPTRH